MVTLPTSKSTYVQWWHWQIPTSNFQIDICSMVTLWQKFQIGQFKVQIESPNWGSKFRTQKVQIEGPNWGSKFRVQIEGPNWGSKLKVQIEGANLGSKLKVKIGQCKLFWNFFLEDLTKCGVKKVPTESV